MRMRELQRERSTTWLRNTGVGREMLRLIQAKGSPVKRIFRQLAELGVPCSMVEGLVGCALSSWQHATPRHEAKLQALWALAEAYTDVANREPGAVEGLEDIVLEAQQLGVWYEPPCCAAVVIDRRANKVRRFVEDIDGPCRPGRSQSHERLWRAVLQGAPARCRLTPELARVVELRLALMTAREIAEELRRSEPTVTKMLRMQVVQDAIEEVRPIAELEQVIACKVRQQAAATRSATMKARHAEGKVAKSPGRPRRGGWDDAWVLEQVALGASVHSIAAKLGTSRQALTYRIQQARRARNDPPPP